MTARVSDAFLVEEADIDRELLDQYQYAEPSIIPGLWELLREPNENESVPIPGTRGGMTLPGDHNVHDLEKLIEAMTVFTRDELRDLEVVAIDVLTGAYAEEL